MNVSDIKEEIRTIKELKFEEHSEDNYKSFYKQVKEILLGNRQVIMAPYFSKSLSLIRARKSADKVFHNLGEIWYPPVFDVTAGRLNFPHKPVFYCSNDITTSLIEVRPQLNDLITIIELDLNVPELQCIQLVADNIPKKTWDEMNPIKREVFKFIVSEMRKYVEPEKIQDYYTTQVFAQSSYESIPENDFDAIAYNSVASSHFGYNFAVKTSFIDNHYKFRSAKIMKVISYQDPDNFQVKCLFKATTLTSYGRMNFNRVVCPGHDISLNNYTH